METFEFQLVWTSFGQEEKSKHKIKANSLKEAVYKTVRKQWDFLTDDNHTYEFSVNKQMSTVTWTSTVEKEYTWLNIDIIRNENSPTPFFRGLFDQPGDWWFSVEYRPKGGRNKVYGFIKEEKVLN